MRRIYTKKGDKGKTSTLLGKMSKDDCLVEAIGSVDELNSWIGLVISYQLSVTSELKNIQTNLMKINAILAGSDRPDIRLRMADVRNLERWIDKMVEELPRLTNFVYPMGEIQVARAVCRRAERAVVRYQLSITNKLNSYIVKYLNRLSDYLFTLARWVNIKRGIKEEIWKVN